MGVRELGGGWGFLVPFNRPVAKILASLLDFSFYSQI